MEGCEVSHRVNNSLQIISSIIGLQVDRLQDEKAIEVYEKVQDKIKMISIAHENLPNTNHDINLPNYIQEIIDYLADTYSHTLEKVNFDLNIEDIDLPIDTAIPLGIIAGELAYNCLNSESCGNSTVGIKLHTEQSNCVLTVNDGDCRLPEILDLNDNELCCMNLVGILTKQLDGQIETGRKIGSYVKITFKT
ncbi:sensor histidine kinase [Methanohalobium evestigatum]|uniref:sensor histidine kinase n=1 Tax=Methanohalobium evestigatum TaxID=2322 RepID=UPI000677742F|nr:histidine kinase dimerization/phosphoacceptor domain -containing protein [Methanohalobium evestigatum]